MTIMERWKGRHVKLMDEIAVEILCEGPICNSGRSAMEREGAFVATETHRSEDQRAAAMTYARGVVSKVLTLTPHHRVGVGRGGTILFACQVCGFERAYGNTFWAA